LEQITPEGRKAAPALVRLLGIKDKANYGIASVTGRELAAVLRQASTLVEFADAVVRR
jgi:hypothetical protein